MNKMNEEAFKDSLEESYNEGVATAIYYLIDEFTKMDKKWSNKAATFCKSLLVLADENEQGE